MSEQQDHLTNLLQQRQTLINEINGLQQQVTEKRDLLLRATGAIEYLQQVGVKLPEPEPAPETEVAEPEVVTEPTPEG
tara:strand:- start:434 stop:667 length:234 start_codon:yes stop_codon:yes gene_type:complete